MLKLRDGRDIAILIPAKRVPPSAQLAIPCDAEPGNTAMVTIKVEEIVAVAVWTYFSIFPLKM